MFGLTAHNRTEPPGWGSVCVFPAAVVLALALGLGLLAAAGRPFLAVLSALFSGAFGSWRAVEETLLKTSPIFLCSLGVAATFRIKVWNIGAEGQYALGAVGGAAMALAFPGLPAPLLIPLMFLGAALAGALWAVIPALLRLRLAVNEIITTLMLNYLGILFLDWLVYGPWKDPASHGFPMTALFPPAAVLGRIPGTRLHWGLPLCAVLGLGLWFFLSRTRLGFELKASGEGRRTASYARMPYDALVLLVMGLCGALAGWAGMVEASAVIGRLQPAVMAGYGFTAIVVAWLARLRPLAIALAAFLLAALRVGVENLMLDFAVPAAFGRILEGLILLCVLAGQFFTTYTFRRTRAAAPESPAPGSGENAA